jgi:hypothetical protein
MAILGNQVISIGRCLLSDLTKTCCLGQEVKVLKRGVIEKLKLPHAMIPLSPRGDAFAAPVAYFKALALVAAAAPSDAPVLEVGALYPSLFPAFLSLSGSVAALLGKIRMVVDVVSHKR